MRHFNIFFFRKNLSGLLLSFLAHTIIHSQEASPDVFQLIKPATESIYLLDSPPAFFSWNVSKGATSYDILGLKQGQSEIVTWAEGLTETNWTPDREFAFGRWYWFVRANHETGSKKSAKQNFEILMSSEFPGSVKGIFPDNDQVIGHEDSAVTFQWTVSLNATRYELLLAKEGESTMRLKTSNLADTEWIATEVLEPGRWYWQIKAFNWLGISESDVMSFTIADAPSLDIITHRQLIPSGWSVINNGLEFDHQLVKDLFPDPPEGMLFFEWVGGDWDVNQFQFGQWNFQDQAMEVGDSGLLFNPGEPFEMEWQGKPVDMGPYIGLFSRDTCISEAQIVDTQPGAVIYTFQRNLEPDSPQFSNHYPLLNKSELISADGISLEKPDLNDVPSAGVDRIYFLEQGSYRGIIPDRQIGSKYLNNYIPGFGVNSPMGIAESQCWFIGGNYEDAEMGELFPDAVEVHTTAGPMQLLEVHDFGEMSGYLDVSQGSTYDGLLYDVSGFNVGGVLGFISGQNIEDFLPGEVVGDVTNNPGVSTFKAPPEVVTDLLPTIFRIESIEGDCGLWVEFDPAPQNIHASFGDTVFFDMGVCQPEDEASKIAWDLLQSHIWFVLEKKDTSGAWHRIVETQDLDQLVLPNVSPTDEGTYRYGYFDVTASEPCQMVRGESGSLYSQPFELIYTPLPDMLPGVFQVVSPESEEVFLSSLQPGVFQWDPAERSQSYDLYVAKQGDAVAERWAGGLTEPQWIPDRTFGPGRWYWYIRANNEAGSVDSSARNFEVLDALEAPGVFHGVYPEANDSILVGESPEELVWSPSSNATRYEVHLAKDDPALLSKISSNLGDNLWELPEPLEMGTWYWKVVALNWLGQTETEVMTFEVVEDKGTMGETRILLDPVKAVISESGVIKPAIDGFFAQLYLKSNGGSFLPVGYAVEVSIGFFWFRGISINTAEFSQPMEGIIRAWHVTEDGPDDFVYGGGESEVHELVISSVEGSHDGTVFARLMKPLQLESPFCANGGTFLPDYDSEFLSSDIYKDPFIGVAGESVSIGVPVGDVCGFGGLFEWSFNERVLGKDGVAGKSNPSLGQFYNTAEWTLHDISKEHAGIYQVRLVGTYDTSETRLAVLEGPAERVLPDLFPSDGLVPVSITVPPFHGVDELLVVEQLPAHSTVIEAGGGKFDVATRTISWTLPAMDAGQVIRYELGFEEAMRDVAFKGTIRSMEREGLEIRGDLIVRHPDQGDGAGAGPFAVRGIPQRFEPGKPFRVVLEILPKSNTQSYVFRETIPQEAGVVARDFDYPVNRSGDHLLFGPFTDGKPRIFTMDLIVEDPNVSQLLFEGTVTMDDETQDISGDIHMSSTLHQPMSISMIRENQTLTLTWDAPGILQEATSILGPFEDSVDQSNPQIMDLNVGERRFFRLSQPWMDANPSRMFSGDPFLLSGLDMKLMPISAGRFVMGSRYGYSDESPLTTVTISKSFWLGETEVTQGQWKAVMGNNPSYFTGDDQLPVESVSWNDAVVFCLKLNQALGHLLPDGYRFSLPTEAEWEYACRAGSTSTFFFGNDPDFTQLSEYAWHTFRYINDKGATRPVGRKLSNPWGLLDIYGNVAEWCSDRYGAYPGGSITDPRGSANGSYRVYRGGAYDSLGESCRSASRASNWPYQSMDSLGFRVALRPGPR